MTTYFTTHKKFFSAQGAVRTTLLLPNMKPRDYCCCAIPVMNVGIYAALFEQFLLALLVAILSVATPSRMHLIRAVYVPNKLTLFFSCGRGCSRICSMDPCCNMFCRGWNTALWLLGSIQGMSLVCPRNDVETEFAGTTCYRACTCALQVVRCVCLSRE